MGLLQNILKGIARDTVNNAINSSISGNVNNVQPPQNANAPKTEQKAVSGKLDLSATANIPPKPAREVSDTFHDGEDGKTVVTYSFMLSRDFVDSKTSALEIDYIAVYRPDCDEDFCVYDFGVSAFIVSSAPENEIYEMIEKYKHSGTPSGVYSFERVTDISPKVYFRACTLVRGSVLYFYAIDRGTDYVNNYIGVMYEKELLGTPLERKMMSEVDEAVRSYRESV